MTPEQFLTKVAELLDGAKPVEPGMYTLYLEDDAPQITHHDKNPAQSNILAMLISRDINEGPTSRMWEQIKDRYAIFTKRIAKCHNHHKP